jgi:pilus assembly protein CpaC
MRITGQKRWIAAVGVQMFIIGVFGSTRLLAQAPLPRVSAATPSAMPAGMAPAADPNTADPDAVTLLVGRSALVDVGSAISRVSLTSATIADALVTSPNQLLVHGKEPGSISMFVWSRAGGVRRYEIIVQRDLARLSDQMRQLFPGEPIQVHSNGKQVVLSGRVSSKEIADKAIAVAGGYVDKKEDVVTLLAAQPGPPSSQVMLRVRFAEVSRSAMTEFGMSFFSSPTGANNNIGRITTQQFSSPNMTDLAWSKVDTNFGSDVTSASGKINFADFLNIFLLNQKYDLGLLIRALQNRGLFESLAEPNLVAESGKEASFLAGGEFPVPVVQGTASNAAVSVEFKEFGVRLNFTPTVNGDRVHLKIKPEVSTLDYGNAVVLNGFRIPALSTRRTETELELRDGQTFAVAGLMNNQMQSTLQKIPGIGDIPILGHLFRSRAAQKNQTELVVMITPEILRENSPGVTTDLPRIPESFLPPLPQDKTRPLPPPAFGPQSRSLAADPQQPAPTTAQRVPPQNGSQPAMPAVDSAAAARSGQVTAPAAPATLAPAAPVPAPVTAPVAAPAMPPAASAPAPAMPGQPRQLDEAAIQAVVEQVAEKAAEEQAANASSEPSVATAAQPLDPKAQRAAAKQAEAEARRQAEEQRRLQKAAQEQAARDAKAAEKARKEEAKREAAARKEMERLAKEQAKREAAAASEKAKDQKPKSDEAARAEEDAKKQALALMQQDRQDEQRAIDAAAERLRVAEAQYQAELARRAQR